MRKAILCSSVALAAALLAGCGTDAPPPSTYSGGSFGPLGDRADLPVDERLSIDGLSGAVDIVRDLDGRPHIYAASPADAARAQGYLVALDRTLQLELLRRTAEGRMAEILAKAGAFLIDQDIAMRHIGLGRVAIAQYEALPDGEERQVLDAYADGVTQVFRQIRAGTLALPAGIDGIPLEAFTDWTGADSLAVVRFQTYLLSYDVDEDLYAQDFFDAARTTFLPSDPDPLIAVRAGAERDLWLFAPARQAFTTTGYPASMATSAKGHGRPRGLSPRSKEAAAARRRLASRATGYLTALGSLKDRFASEGFGSNNWAVDPSRSATGHALLASDPHLTLSAPSVFWPVSLEVTAPVGASHASDIHASGVAFPGIPGIALGHNEHIAWGATVAYYDVVDAYDETLTADGKAVLFNGAEVPLETVQEIIEVQGGDPVTYDVQIVPHHGPILPTIASHAVQPLDPTAGALSVRWTGLEPTGELEATLGLLRASSVGAARAELAKFSVGAQNWVIADTTGDILWTSHASVPIRDPRAFAWDASTYSGNLPCLVLPGDGTAEWKGYLPDDLVPWSKNPASGYLATANNDPIGDTADNDPSNGTLPDGTPMFLQCVFDLGFREGRIQDRIEGHDEPLSVDDMAAIQADVRSPLGSLLVPEILAAAARAEEERTEPGTHPDLSAVVADPAYDPARLGALTELFARWRDDADYEAASGVDPDTGAPLADEGDSPEAIRARASVATLGFNVWLVRVLRRTLGDELSALGYAAFQRGQQVKSLLRLYSVDPAELATFDPSTQDSALWDDMATPDVVESRDEDTVRSLMDAAAWLEEELAANPEVRWGSYHTVTFNALVPLFGELSIPPASDAAFPNGFPRPGDEFVVDASDYRASYPLNVSPSFNYISGPAQRFVVDMDPAGPRAWNALPGGNVWDAASPHFRDEAELWRKNLTHPVPFLLGDVIAVKESRTVAARP